jgi:signal transduction histidine kinase/CheY-like chemotaxis protein
MTASSKRIGSWRTAPVVIFASAILIVLVGLGVIVQTDNAYKDARREFAVSQARLLAATTAAAVDFNDPVAAQEAVNPLKTIVTLRMAAVYGREGQLIAGYDRSGEAVPAVENGIQTLTSQFVRASAPIESAGQRIGTVYVQLDRQPVWRRVTRYGMLGVLFAAAAVIVLGLGFAQRALRIANRELANRAEALAQANEMLGEQMEERAKAEDQLRQSQKMQALGQLTGGIAHDFNNLLTVIQGSADMLCKKDLPEPKRVRFAKAIVQASENAAALTSQLLAFARRQPLKPERLDLDQVLVEMQDLIDRTMGERVQVRMVLDGPPCSIETDKAQLQSAILNIASNARDAMTDGGELKISTRESNEEAGRMVAIDFADNGHGMDPETLDRVFEPFFTTKGTGKGTGLGLSQVYGFASQSGGEVRATSEVGKGTTVSLLLPCHEAEPIATSSAGERVASPPRSAAILVVEDNEEVAVFAQHLLSELGHKVTRASSAEDALELSRAEDFDLVFSDVVMPGLGGLKLAQALAEEKPALPVVLATGYSEEISEAGSGGRPVILKPYRLATLSEAIASALNGPIEAAK